MASRPCAWRSPKKDSFQPENGKNAMGAATPILTPTIPTSMRSAYSRADLPFEVKMEVVFPNRELLPNGIGSFAHRDQYAAGQTPLARGAESRAHDRFNRFV